MSKPDVVRVSLLLFAGSALALLNGSSTLVVAATKPTAGVLVQDRSLSEISGCGVSSINPGVIWVHNDSGDAAQAYAVSSTTGKTVLTASLSGVEATDIEDMALYNGKLYLADIGDNAGKRKSVRIQSFAEPKVPGSKKKTSVKVTAQTRTLTYEDGPHDAEAFFIDTDGTMVIVTKSIGRVYRAGADDVLKPVASLNIPLVTGADRSTDGKSVLIRTYITILRYDRSGDGPFDAVWKAKPTAVVGPFLAQAEAVCIEPGNKAAWTMSEGQGGAVLMYRLPL